MINETRVRRDVVTVGASAGGVDALIQLFQRLPGDLSATIGVVIHRSPLFESNLAGILQRRSTLRFLEARGGEPVQHGCVYIAPRDRHMLFEGGAIRLDRGPKQHFTRPAVDPLFFSAAESFGSRVVGVLLTGGGDDGASGLRAIKKVGGISVVQDPREAEHPSMPTHGIVYDAPDAVLKVSRIAEALYALARGEVVISEEPTLAQPARTARL